MYTPSDFVLPNISVESIGDVEHHVTSEFKRIQKYSVNEATWIRKFKHIPDLKQSIKAKNA